MLLAPLKPRFGISISDQKFGSLTMNSEYCSFGGNRRVLVGHFYVFWIQSRLGPPFQTAFSCILDVVVPFWWYVDVTLQTHRSVQEQTKIHWMLNAVSWLCMGTILCGSCETPSGVSCNS